MGKNLGISSRVSLHPILINLTPRLQVFLPQALHPLIFFLFKSREEKKRSCCFFSGFANPIKKAGKEKVTA